MEAPHHKFRIWGQSDVDRWTLMFQTNDNGLALAQCRLLRARDQHYCLIYLGWPDKRVTVIGLPARLRSLWL